MAEPKKTTKKDEVKPVKKAEKDLDTEKKTKKPVKKVEKTSDTTKEKKTAVKETEETAADSAAKKKVEYLYAVGRRKSAVAQVRVYKKGEGKITINGKDLDKYFPTKVLQDKLAAALKTAGQQDKLDVSVKVLGGGFSGQAEAIRHGIARALIQLNPNFRKPLKKAGYITRDARKKERKKPGLKKARKAPQWKKR
ncbi:30S ribosomal protein S9 [Candidatus Falkowbacteria bacterium]|jgi:small subunit ribosomal protein S9|nr:30S ribosomal protein S9 [Candidatus Falkowbacteria bacterium]